MLNSKRVKSKKWLAPIFLILVFSMALLTGCEDSTPIHDDGTRFTEYDDIRFTEDDGTRLVEETEIEEGSEEAVEDGESPAASIVDGVMEVHFIDVGQGDSILIKQDGSNMLIDAGENWCGDLVVNYLEEQGVNSLEYVVGTHPHSDHIGGLDDVINHFPVENVIMPDVTHTSKTFEDVILAIQNKDLKITKPVVGESFSLGEGEFTIVGPNRDSYDNLNDYSVMLRLTFGENSFMLTGDAEHAAETDAVKNKETLQSDVLKVGHHGSDTSTIDSFINEVNPTYAVIQVGGDNQYGHPNQSVLDKLDARCVEVYRTDLHGNIIAISDGIDVRFETSPSKGLKNNFVKKDSEGVARDNKVEDSSVGVEDAQYIGNKNSKVFHNKSCGSLPAEHNQEFFSSRDEAIDTGYKACGNCKP